MKVCAKIVISSDFVSETFSSFNSFFCTFPSLLSPLTRTRNWDIKLQLREKERRKKLFMKRLVVRFKAIGKHWMKFWVIGSAEALKFTQSFKINSESATKGARNSFKCFHLRLSRAQQPTLTETMTNQHALTHMQQHFTVNRHTKVYFYTQTRMKFDVEAKLWNSPKFIWTRTRVWN